MLREKCLWKAGLQKESSMKALSGKQNHMAKLHVRPSGLQMETASHVEGQKEVGRKNGKLQLWQIQPINFTRQLCDQKVSGWQPIFLQSLFQLRKAWSGIMMACGGEEPLRSQYCFILVVQDMNVSSWLTAQNKQEASKMGSSCWHPPCPLQPKQNVEGMF